MADEWNILAGRLIGDGSIEILETELPLRLDTLDRSLSAPSAVNGTISNTVLRLKKDGKPIFTPGNTVIIAEADGLLRGMAIYKRPEFNGEEWVLDTIGLGGYPNGQPWTADQKSYVAADPLDIYRDIWAHLQGQAMGNIGVTIDSTKSPIRVGTAVKAEDRSGDTGPRVLNWWETTDLGSVIDSYSQETPFDWVERIYWDGDQPRCHIELGYPTLGGRRHDGSFELGVNLAEIPSAIGGDPVNQLHLLGAGEGRERIRGYAGVTDGNIRWARAIGDESQKKVDQANAAARMQLAALRGDLVVSQLEVFDTASLPLEQIEVGDERMLIADTPWLDINYWVRVIGKSETPGSDRVTLTVVRMEAL